MEPINVAYKDYIITTDKSKLSPEAAHKWLSEESYWSKDIPLAMVQTAFDNSLAMGVLWEGKQVGYARFITDYSSFGYLADVYVLEQHRGKGISKKMMEVLLEQDWVKTLRNIMLGTLDAHGLYTQYGFGPLKTPERMMQINRAGIYTTMKNK